MGKESYYIRLIPAGIQLKLSTNDNNNSYLFDGSSNIQKKEIINLIRESLQTTTS